MILGIDASNIRGGGGVTHLVELLHSADPQVQGFSQVIVWGGHAILGRIDDRPWLVKSHQVLLDRSLPHRAFWQRFRLSRLAKTANCDVLFVPGGSFAGNFYPIVAMSQNLLPFERSEIRRFGWSWMTIKLLLLRGTQVRTFRRAAGLVFLTQYARDVVMGVIDTTSGTTIIVPHGIDKRFFCMPREQSPINQYSTEKPFRVLYVSIIDMYKHQWWAAEAIAELRAKNVPVTLDLIGPGYPPAMSRLRRTLHRIDPHGEFVRYSGYVSHHDLPTRYAQADVCLFASSCENMPNVLLEGMASGLPIACSNRGPMREILRDAGVYFDPEDSHDIARALRALIDSPETRIRMASASMERALAFSWERCARETFAFLSCVAREHNGIPRTETYA